MLFLQNSSLGRLHTDGDVVPTFGAVPKDFNLYGLQHVRYTILDFFKVPKLFHLRTFLGLRKRKKCQGLRSGEYD